MARGKEAVEREVEAKVPYLIRKGGYMPAPDHSIPPDVPLENSEHYLRLVREACGE